MISDDIMHASKTSIDAGISQNELIKNIPVVCRLSH